MNRRQSRMVFVGVVLGGVALATVLASVLLAPILPPRGDTVFGVKTARSRLALLGWRT